MKMPQPETRLLQMMHDRNGCPLPDTVARDWYVARRYVLDNLKAWTLSCLGTQGPGRFHVALRGNSSLAKAIARHIALVAHFPHFDETRPETRVRITLLYENRPSMADLEAEAETLKREEYLNNLMVYGNYSLVSAAGGHRIVEGLPFLETEIELRSVSDIADYGEALLLPDDDTVRTEVTRRHGALPDAFSETDVIRGMRVNGAYCLGDTIDNLPSEDNDTPMRYNIALDYLRAVRHRRREEMWLQAFSRNADGSWSISQRDLRNRISSIFCGDTFESHIRSIMGLRTDITRKYLFANARSIRKALRANLEKLARVEHARWNAEKLILGFRPLTDEEALKDERAHSRRGAYRRSLKNHATLPAHIDIAGYADLKRINPQDLKYDCFIILAIPYILRKTIK